MEIKEIIAQGIGILAMAFNILSYQGKKQQTVIALQLIGGALFAVAGGYHRRNFEHNCSYPGGGFPVQG